jgi:hypothetical protein
MEQIDVAAQQQEKIATVTALIRGDNEDQGDKGADEKPGSSAQDNSDVGDDSGTRQDDLQGSERGEGVSDDEQDAKAQADSGSDSDEQEITLATLAEYLNVDPADVYEIEVPIGEGEKISIGALKDEYKQYGPVREATAKIQERERSYERSLMKTRTELNAILATLPIEIREQAAMNGKQYQAQWEQQQEKMVLETIPEWADADQRAKFREMLIEDGAEYGFSEAEITYTQDARTLKMLKDFATMKRELQAMKASTKRVPGKANPPGKANKSTSGKRRLAQAMQRAKADPSIQGKASFVSELIRNS